MSEQTPHGWQPATSVMQLPQQTPPIDRTAAMPGSTGDGTPGVEANVLPLLPLLGGLGGLLGGIFG
ncbi:hypothetical protein [Streptomyces sp. NPDC017230]|uniref:hypothetical protein n=1 Tax=unclassified Streptomyces TaxID=2593676 RepID=UPI003799F367